MMRPDERANLAEIERDKKFKSNISKGIAAAGTLIGGVGTASITSKILPFLNEYVPKDLAIKGLEKVSPKIGQFLRRGESMGLNVEEGLQFIKDNMSSSQSTSEQTSKRSQENRNIVEQYSPELHQFILSEIQKGRSPLEAGAIAQMERKGGSPFKQAIDKLIKDHKTSWSNILNTVYGTSENPQSNMQQQNIADQQQTQQSGQGQQQLMSILQKIQQSRGA